jgi:hypothetical protein
VAEIFREVDEDVRRARYEKLWKAYGKYIVGAAVGIVVATVAVVGWRQYQLGQREAEGERFAAALALAAEGRSADAANAFTELAGEAGRGYRVLARFQAAAALKDSGAADRAVAIYDQIAAEGGAGATLRDLAALLAVQTLFDQASASELEQRLERLLGDDNPWRYSARELAALVALKSGDTSAAREGFAALADDAGAPAGLRARATEMLAAIGGTR